MKVLVVSLESWNSLTNGGNVLSNIFSNFTAEFKQIYCSGGIPDNDICKEYYQISDKMIVDKLLKNKKVGKHFILDNVNKVSEDEEFEKNSKKIKRWQIVFLIRELLWSLVKVDNDSFIKFIQDYNPDIIFAPCYSQIRMIKLLKTIKKYTDAPVVSYVSDDLYSYDAYDIDPLFWIRRFNLRRHIRGIFKYYSLVYTMSIEQLEEYQKEFNTKMKILMKSCDYNKVNEIKKPYRIIYAGGIYLNRVDILCEVARSISKLNENGINFILDIYSNGVLSEKESKILNNQKFTFFNGAISYEKLKEEYNNCSIALHVESFDKKNALITRLSFSTKITDCLQSGATVMAICPSINAGFNYLKREDAAICIDNIDDIYTNFKNILDNPLILEEYSNKAKNCILRNHNKDDNIKKVYNDFSDIIYKR